jgi:TATA-box binding protein (TBP) (component of TFIID and TFIIIB)
MATIDDYVSRVEGTCGAEKDVIVIFKFEKKDEAIANILKKATLKNKIAGIIFELTFKGASFRLYSSGKAIFRSVKNREELKRVISKPSTLVL